MMKEEEKEVKEEVREMENGKQEGLYSVGKREEEKKGRLAHGKRRREELEEELNTVEWGDERLCQNG